VCNPRRPKEEEEIKAAVESCGYVYKGTDIAAAGTRARRFIDVVCPNGHELRTMWDNFKPVNGKPKKCCAQCGNKDAHHRMPRVDIPTWAAEHRVKLLDKYEHNAVPYSWECNVGHRFTVTWAAMRLREVACVQCGLLAFAQEHSLALLTDSGDCSSSEPLSWRCLLCNTAFDASMLAIRRRIKCCPNPECDPKINIADHAGQAPPQ